MLVIVGWVIVMVCVIGGYMMMGGKLGPLWQPFELVIIGGAGVGAFVGLAVGTFDHVTVLLSDYRDIKGEYDRLVSIEMIEAVGHVYLSRFFSCLFQFQDILNFR